MFQSPNHAIFDLQNRWFRREAAPPIYSPKSDQKGVAYTQVFKVVVKLIPGSEFQLTITLDARVFFSYSDGTVKFFCFFFGCFFPLRLLFDLYSYIE